WTKALFAPCPPSGAPQELVGTLSLCPSYELQLAAERALCVEIERVDRLACGHEQAVALHAAEAEVGAALWQGDAADHDGVGGIDHDAVELGIAHAPAAPQIADAAAA